MQPNTNCKRKPHIWSVDFIGVRVWYCGMEGWRTPTMEIGRGMSPVQAYQWWEEIYFPKPP